MTQETQAPDVEGGLSRDHAHAAGSVTSGQSHTLELRYRGYDIYPSDPLPPIPSWRDHAWTFAHKDYDGPEDNRCGTAASPEDCRAEIDEREGDYPAGWQLAQAAKCPCRGSDDCCSCINQYWPERYGLQETEKCEDCGRLASELTHRFCEAETCPVRAAIAKAEGLAPSSPEQVAGDKSRDDHND